MDATYYCDTMYAEMTGLKARIYNIVREMEKLPEDARTQAATQLSEMHELMDTLKAKIDDLGRECPADWSSQKEEIDKIKSSITEKVNLWDAEHIAGGYVGG